jgi:Icc-related predicted phosphoesterase
MKTCFFVTDLHGSQSRFRKLFEAVEQETPAALFLGGDLSPSGLGGMLGAAGHEDFMREVLAAGFLKLKESLGPQYPAVFLILGNDDVKIEEERLKVFESQSLWTYAHNRCIRWESYSVYGYACVPPTPFMLKDWERYDVSTHLDPLCVAPEEGWFSVPVSKENLRYETIQRDLQQLVLAEDLSQAIFLFHTPPYKTGLDRAALDGKKYEHVDLDVHVGSIAIRRFIESKQPLLTLHGHIHESARITGIWKEQIGRTDMISAAHDGPDLVLVRFDPDDPAQATRELL